MKAAEIEKRISEKARADGRAEGKAEAVLEIIDNIMEAQHCSLEKACLLAGKTVDEYNSAKALCQIEP